MKKIYALFLMCLFWQIINTTPLQAQTWGMNFTWVQQGAGSSSEDGRSIAKDALGNVYVAGNFHGTVTFGSTSLNSSGGKDISIVKYDASGNVLWARKVGGTGYDTGYGIAVDDSGNAYLTGLFSGTAAFGSTSLTSSGYYDVFLAKYDASGNALWAQKAGGTGYDIGIGIAVDDSGNAYLTGYFRETATFGSTSLTSSGLDDVFLAKYDALGNVLWAQQAGGTGYDVGTGIAVDDSGNAYLTGYFREAATFGSTSLTSSGQDDVFIAKYDALGNVLWAQQAGGTGYDRSNGIAVDGLGNAYLTGFFRETATFGSTTLTSSGLNDVFIAKYSASGNALWARKAGGTGYDTGNGIAVDNSGNAYVTGSFQATTTFGSTSLTSSDKYDVFIAKYSASGNALWALKAGGTGGHGYDAGYGIAVDGADNVYATGSFYGTGVFGSTSLSASGDFDDAFIARLNWGLIPPTVTGAERCGPGALTLSASGAADGNYRWYTTQTGGSPIASASDWTYTTPSLTATTTYYVSVVDADAESQRTAVTATINPIPAAPEVSASLTYCQGSAAAALTAIGSSLKWYGAATGGSGSATAPTPSTATAGTFYYYVSQTVNNCESERATIEVVVKAAPAVEAGSDQTVCFNEEAFPLSGFSPAGGTWSGAGISANGVFSPAAAGAGTHTLTYSYTQDNCTATDTKTVTVRAEVTLAPFTSALCQDNTGFTLTGGQPTGGTYSGTGVSNGVFYASTAGAGTHTISYTYTANGCTATASQDIIVNPLPAAPQVSAITYCQGSAAAALTATGSNLKWYGAATGGSGSATAPTPSTATAGTYYYYVSQTVNNCESERATIEVVVKAAPAVEAGSDQTVCFNEEAFPLSGFSPAGGTWSGTGVSGEGVFSPAMAGAGTHTLTYSYTQDNCTATDTKTITVRAEVTLAPFTSALCQDNTGFTLTGGQPTGGTYSGTGVSNGVFYASTAGAGTHTISYTYTANGCTATASQDIIVNPLPAAPQVSAITYCQGSAAVVLTAEGSNLKWYTAATGGSGSATAPTPSTAATGTFYYYVSQTVGGCESERATMEVVVKACEEEAPDFAWARQGPGNGSSVGASIAKDAFGNIYITGNFWGSIQFGSTSLTSSGNQDVFIAKYSASGKVLWAQKAGGISSDQGHGIAVDNSGNAYLTGYFRNTATFGSTTLTSSGERDVFIAKYDASGNALWAQQAGGTDYDMGYGIALDNAGNAYITGNFRGTAAFGSISLSSSSVDADVFIAKYDASGKVLWAQQAGGTEYETGFGIAVDDSGNAYLTGLFNGTAAFGSTSLTSSGEYDVFLAKYDASGNALWAQKAGGTGDDQGKGIAVDGSGNAYITGYFNGTVTLGSVSLTSSGKSDVFIAKYNASGNALWAQKAGGTGYDEGSGITLDSSGNAYVTGWFEASATFGSTSLASSGSKDVFLAKYAASSNILWAQKAGGASGDYAYAYGIAVDNSGNASITGWFSERATFGSTSIATNGTWDVFLARLGSIASPSVTGAERCGPGAVTLTASGAAAGNYRWYTSETGGSAIASATDATYTTPDLTVTTTYYVSVMNGDAESQRTAVTATITPLPAAPEVMASMTYCQGSAAVALTAEGSNLKWYTAATGGSGSATAPTPSTATAGTFYYYVSQTVNNCESERARIEVVVTICKIEEALDFSWARQGAGDGTNVGASIAKDALGNIYVTGSFSGSIQFGSISLTSSGSQDVFLAKYSTSGNVLWAQRAGGADSDEGYGIAVDGSGNAYVTGKFSGTATFGNMSLISSGGDDVFIAKYNASGNALWAQKAGGTGYDGSSGIAVDNSGNAYVTGLFSNSEGYGEIFIAKYSALGNALWAQKAGHGRGHGIALDGSGNAYVTGAFGGTATFGSTSLSSSGGNDVFIAKYSASGNALWAQKAGGPDFSRGRGIAVDKSGNAYVTGEFNGTAAFGSTSLTSSGGSLDVFLAKYSASGNALWAQQAGGENYDIGYGIAVDGSGNAYLTGRFWGTTTFGSTLLTSSGGDDVFIAKFSASGNVLWVQKAGGTGSDIGHGIALDNSGNAYVTGEFKGKATFGSISLTSSGSSDVFIAKLGRNLTPPTVTGAERCGPGAVTLTASGAAAGNYRWYTSETGGSAIASATDATYTTPDLTVTTTYYVSVVSADAESQRTAVTATINPLPAAPEITASLTYCQGSAAAALTASGSNLNWYAAATGGTGSATAPTPSTATAGTFYYYVSQTVNNCESERARITVVVNAMPSAEAGSDQAVCASEGAVTLSGFSPAGGSWSGVGVSANGIFNPAMAGVGTHTLTYTVTQDNCTARATKTITVTAVPEVTLASFAKTLCRDNTGFNLTGGLPAGGTYSGAGVSNGVFHASTAGVGTHTITYTYTANGCTATATQDITVSTCTGIAESALAASLLLYPNPTQDKLQVILPLPGKTPLQLRLLDTKGQVVLKQTFSSVSGEFNQVLHLKDAPAGVYMLQLITKEEVINKRIVKE